VNCRGAKDARLRASIALARDDAATSIDDALDMMLMMTEGRGKALRYNPLKRELKTRNLL
jgi:hypothetical protein